MENFATRSTPLAGELVQRGQTAYLGAAAALPYMSRRLVPPAVYNAADAAPAGDDAAAPLAAIPPSAPPAPRGGGVPLLLACSSASCVRPAASGLCNVRGRMQGEQLRGAVTSGGERAVQARGSLQGEVSQRGSVEAAQRGSDRTPPHQATEEQRTPATF